MACDSPTWLAQIDCSRQIRAMVLGSQRVWRDAVRARFMGMANRIKLTRSRKDKFLKRLGLTCNVTASAVESGCNAKYLYEARQKDPGFAREWDDAIESAVASLEQECRRRALLGVTRPVFYQGRECGSYKEFSDTLAIFLLKAHRPEKYRERVQLSGELEMKGGVLLVPAAAESVEAWQASQGEQNS